ncbi:hypothetical protein PtA15_5A649 [Puccinia triticina]|uniref:Aminotransferase class I/classII domain-containing protein n=1 Tax=Puccinia triticina TaxID=208348 RepID=A0ABY7CJ30_9BASI|nr:uncharacterized protein PtA15_5A649 [Puccinia triticina]WAQ85075.1 hypothetical protein PtA15_5A649 [Puccinia triticina]
MEQTRLQRTSSPHLLILPCPTLTASPPGFPFASETSPGNWHIFGNLLRLTVPLGLCTVDQYNLALLLRCFKELISVFEKHPSVPSLSAA